MSYTLINTGDIYDLTTAGQIVFDSTGADFKIETGSVQRFDISNTGAFDLDGISYGAVFSGTVDTSCKYLQFSVSGAGLGSIGTYFESDTSVVGQGNIDFNFLDEGNFSIVTVKGALTFSTNSTQRLQISSAGAWDVDGTTSTENFSSTKTITSGAGIWNTGTSDLSLYKNDCTITLDGNIYLMTDADVAGNDGEIIISTSKSTTQGVNNITLNTGLAGGIILQTNTVTHAEINYAGDVTFTSVHGTWTSSDVLQMNANRTTKDAEGAFQVNAQGDILIKTLAGLAGTGGGDIYIDATVKGGVAINGRGAGGNVYLASAAGTAHLTATTSTARVYGDLGVSIDTSTGGDVTIKTGTSSPTRLLVMSTGELVTGGLTTTDVDPGGISLYQAAGNGPTVTLKSSSVTHPFIAVVDHDTYGAMRKFHSSYGGISIQGFNSYTSTTDSSACAIQLYGYCDQPPADSTASAYGAIQVVGCLWDGAAINSLGAADNIFVVRNYTAASLIVKGSGQVYNDYATSMTTFDNEDDIALARATQLAVGHDTTRLSPEMVDKLQDLGVFEGSMGCMQKIHAVELGAIQQLWNMIKGIANGLGITDTELATMAKMYK